MTTPADPTQPTGYPSETTFGAGGPVAAPGNEATGGAQSDSLKDAGRGTASTAKDEARKGASTASDQVHQVTSETGAQARRLYDESIAEARYQTDSQMTRLGGRMREIADEVREMANGSQQQGVASQLAGDLAYRGGRMADWLESHGPDEALAEVRRYARRHPVSFLALAAGAGLVVGRFARALQQGDPDRSTGGQYSYGSQAPFGERAYPHTPADPSGNAETGEGAYGRSGPYTAETDSHDPYANPTPGPAAASRRIEDTGQIWDDQR